MLLGLMHMRRAENSRGAATPIRARWGCSPASARWRDHGRHVHGRDLAGVGIEGQGPDMAGDAEGCTLGGANGGGGRHCSARISRAHGVPFGSC